MKTFAKIIIVQLNFITFFSTQPIHCETKKVAKSSLIENCPDQALIKKVFSDSNKFIAIKFESGANAKFGQILLPESLEKRIDFYVVDYRPWVQFLEKALYRSLNIAKIEFPMVVVFRYGKVQLPIHTACGFDVNDKDQLAGWVSSILNSCCPAKSQPWLFETTQPSALALLNCSGGE